VARADAQRVPKNLQGLRRRRRRRLKSANYSMDNDDHHNNNHNHNSFATANNSTANYTSTNNPVDTSRKIGKLSD
jgi:hypothetical protein